MVLNTILNFLPCEKVTKAIVFLDIDKEHSGHRIKLFLDVRSFTCDDELANGLGILAGFHKIQKLRKEINSKH